jgi:hypothetical protein
VGNRAYLSVWCREFSESTLLSTFQKFLETVPASPSRPGFTQLTILAVNYAEPPVIEHDLRGRPLAAAEIARAAGEIVHDDVCYEVEAHWDLWSCDAEKNAWRLSPHRLEIACRGEQFDEGAWEESGHFSVDLGFEDLFTGDERLSGDEHREYSRKNILALQDWVGRILTALPVDKVRMCSEGEESFEDRVDAILAAG